MSLQEPSASGRADYATRFKAGVSGNPGGKPTGTLKALQTRFLKDIKAKWDERGEEALDALIEERPDKFCELVTSILPQEKTLNVNHESSPELQRVSRTIEWLEKHLERSRAARASEVVQPERPVFSAIEHSGES